MKDKRILMGTSLVLLLLLTTGLSYAYFSTSVKGNDNAKDMVVEAGTLKLTYTDGPAINVQNIKPGWTTTKTVSVKNNGTLDTNYKIIWQSLTNGIINDELVISATCQRLNASGVVEGTCESISQAPISDMTISNKISIDSGITHKYTFTILFKETNAEQNYNQGKEFNGVLGIEEYKDTAVYCTYDGKLTQGAEYVNGQYSYRYMQENAGTSWNNINNDGWGVTLTNKNNTEPVTTKLCTYINNKPIVSMSEMFADSKATTLDLSDFNTSKVTNMDSMFQNCAATIITGLSNFNTENVTNMRWMFSGVQATTLDLSNFNTSKVTNMSSMFASSKATTLDLSSFDTSKVTDMTNMFYSSQATTLDLSSFDTSKVTNMASMFQDGAATIITGLSNFNTENVTDMRGMFSNSQAITLDLSNFNTSKVTDMNSMFSGSQATKLDLSSFDTKNVECMENMFSSVQATTLDLSNFNTSNVIEMREMFSYSNVEILILNDFSTYNKDVDCDMMFFNCSNLKTIYINEPNYDFDTSKLVQFSHMFDGCTSLVGGAGTVYDENHIDGAYAHIDLGEYNPGYFTDIADKE